MPKKYIIEVPDVEEGLEEAISRIYIALSNDQEFVARVFRVELSYRQLEDLIGPRLIHLSNKTYKTIMKSFHKIFLRISL